MPLVVEDGTGLPDANSYASYADWLAHWADRGTAPAGDQTAVEQALVRAADFLDIRYRWRGAKLTAAQGLEWPRAYAYRGDPAFDAGCAPIEGVPAEVVRANIELAGRALAGELAPDPVVSATGQTVVATRRKVGPLETEDSFNGGGSSAWVKRFPAVDKLLRDVVVHEGGRVYRA
jgi:hypothetical protein